MNKLTWDNPVLMGPAMAERMGIKTEDLVELELNGKKVTAPVWIQVGHPDNSVTVFLGYGRRRAGRVGTGAGFDMYPLRTSATPWFTSGVAIRKTGGTYKLASTQGYQTMDTPTGTRPLVRTARSGGVPQGTRLRARRRAAEGTDFVQALSLCGRALRLGHDGRYECLRGLQQLHRRLPVGEQYCRRRQGTDRARAGTCTGCAWIPITRATATIPRPTSSRCRASSARTLPAKWFARWARPCTAAKA